MFLLALLLTIVPVASPTPPIAIMVNVQPSFLDPYMLLTRKTPYTYTCRATVADADQRKGIANAEVIVERGKSETIKQSRGEYELEFTVKINGKGDRADTHVIVRRGGATITEQRSVTALMPPPSATGR